MGQRLQCKACPDHHTDSPQAGPYKGETRSITTQERGKMFLLRGRNTLLPDLPGAEANGPRASK